MNNYEVTFNGLGRNMLIKVEAENLKDARIEALKSSFAESFKLVKILKIN